MLDIKHFVNETCCMCSSVGEKTLIKNSVFNRLIKHLDSTRQHWSTVFLEASPHTKPFSLKCSKQQQNKSGQDAGLQLVEAQLADS